MEKSQQEITDYDSSEAGFKNYLEDLADRLFPFPDYRDYQDEILYETLEAFFVDGYRNVVIEGPTGIGKSPLNVTVGRVISTLHRNQSRIEDHFGIVLRDLQTGNSFYTTPQKSLRNQLAEDDDLRQYVSMLKSRRDYTCGVTGDNCAECAVRSSTEESCLQQSDCTYWTEKMNTVRSNIGVITFAMLIIDNYLPVESENGERISFDDRDLVTIDEGHNSEGQSSSLFAGYTLSPWKVPPTVYGNAGEEVGWGESRFEHVEDIVLSVRDRAKQFINQHEEDPQRQSQVENCENIIRKIDYTRQTAQQGRGWVVNIDQVNSRQGQGTTKKIQIKPVRVDDFLADFVWSRGRRRLITSATIPFRGNVDKWGERIGLDGEIKFIAKPTPFPASHRQIHLNTMVGEMSGDSEDENWDAAMEQIREIHSHHEGEKGVIHSVSYPRGEKVEEALDSSNVIRDRKDLDTDALLTRWQNSDRDIFISPTVTEGVDLYGDRCRWQVLLKAPFAYYGDNRVSYLLEEEGEWDWYYEETAIDIIQSVGRAVRGPEADEAASFYIIDEKFEDVMYRTNPPEYFVDAVRDDPPEHWENPDAAPWR